MSVSMFPKTKPPQQQQPPSGFMLMLKAMGIEFDPNLISTLANAVEEIRARLERIETKLDALQIQEGQNAVITGRTESAGCSAEKAE